MSVASPAIYSYKPYGKARELMLCKASEILLSGPAGTGKSRACLEKVHLCAMKYDGMRGLIVRKTRESLSESGLVTFEDKVLTPNDPIKQGAQRRLRQIYSYPNGSEIVTGGMDKPSKIMSTEFDMVYVQEATELTEDDWESLTTRLRNAKMPYQQLIADCNPSSNSHWLKKRAERGGLLMLESRHRDNPSIWDEQAQDWTAAGKQYLAKLDALTGVRKKRLRDGIWAAAEGMVYEEVWEPAIHLIPRFEIPNEWPRFLSVDFGFTNPFVAQFWAEDPDGILYRYREIYYTQRLVEDHARQINELLKDGPTPLAVICDHDAEGRATLERYLGLSTMPAFKVVTAGIQAVAARLRVAENKKPRIYFLRDSLVESDPRLVEMKKPTCTEEEIEGYVWDISNNRNKGEEPVKKDDHGCFVAGTMIETVNGARPIESLKPGDLVLTRAGYMPVKSAGMSLRSAEVMTLRLSNGQVLTGTPNHPIFVQNKGFIRLDAMRYGDIIFACEKTPTLKPKSLFLTVLAFVGILIQKIGRRVNISLLTLKGRKKGLDVCTRKSGKRRTALYLRGVKSIIKTVIRLTTILPTSNACQRKSIGISIKKDRNRTLKWLAKTLFWQVSRPKNGIVHQPGALGIVNMVKKRFRIVSRSREFVSNASLFIGYQWAIENQIGFAPITANLLGDVRADLITKPGFANFAVNRSPSINTVPQNSATVSVLSMRVEQEKVPVYNLTIDKHPEYYANGVLVHNCDAARYLVAYFDSGQMGSPTLW